jgi:transposase
MELVSVIRHKVLTEGVPIRDVARQLGLSRNTIRRYVRAKVVPVSVRGANGQARARSQQNAASRPFLVRAFRS